MIPTFYLSTPVLASVPIALLRRAGGGGVVFCAGHKTVPGQAKFRRSWNRNWHSGWCLGFMVLECAYRSRRILELCGAAMWELVRCGAEDNGIVHGRSAHKGGLQGEIMMTTISSAGTVPGAGAGFLD